MSFRRSISKIFISFLAVIFIFSQAPSIYSAENIDQYCSGPWGGWSKINGHSDISQTFIPTQNRLTRVGLVLRGEGGGSVYIRIQKGSNTIASGSVSEPNGDETWLYEDFDDVNLTPGDTYRIKLTTASNSAGWYRSSSSGCCDSGSAYLDGTQKSYDWGFGTWGWTYTPPEEPEDDESDDSQPVVDEENNNEGDNSIDQEGVSKGTGEEPSEEVNFDIDPPSNLEAVDLEDDQGGTIRLNWKRSDSSDVDGYYIFRSTDRDEGYKNIAKTKSSVKQYLDKEAVTGTAYYYLLRSYQNTDQSPDSNKVKATAIDNLAPNTPENFVIATQQDDRLIFTWDKNSEEDLAGYQLEVVELNDQDQSIEIPLEVIEIGKDETEYVLVYSDHGQIDTEKEIRYYLKAKDENDNLSERAGPLSAQEQEEEVVDRTAIWYASLIALVVLLAILAGLIYWEKKKGKKAKTGKKTKIDVKKKK